MALPNRENGAQPSVPEDKLPLAYSPEEEYEEQTLVDDVYRGAPLSHVENPAAQAVPGGPAPAVPGGEASVLPGGVVPGGPVPAVPVDAPVQGAAPGPVPPQAPYSPNSGSQHAAAEIEEYYQKKYKKKLFAWRLLTLAFTLCFVFTLFAWFITTGLRAGSNPTRNLPYLTETQDGKNPGAREKTAQNNKKLDEIYKLIRDNYYKKLTDEQIWTAIYTGLAKSLGSPYTHYMTPEEAQAFRQSVSGEYSGIGATVHVDQEKGIFELLSVRSGSPAEQAGLRNGDILQAIDGTPIKEFKNAAAVAQVVKGKEGTTVEIEVLRPSQDNKRLTFKVTRGKIKTEVVTHRMLTEPGAEGIGYLRMTEFTETLPQQFIPALKDLVSKGAKQIVLDLRDNPGGDANAMMQCLDAILPAGPIATIRGRHDGKEYEDTWVSTDKVQIPADVHFAILLNRYSASASEFFSGALRDRGRAILIGEKTYGKGVATQSYSLPDGSAISITTFEYILPKGDHVDGKGLTPGIESKLPENLLSKPIEELTWQEDTQLQRAVEYFHTGH